MEHNRSEALKISDMVMCGDHSSFTKPDLAMDKAEGDKKPLTVFKVSPTSSRTAADGARRRPRSSEVSSHEPNTKLSTAALVQAALGSFRWPPYLLCVWVLVLMLTHALHGLVSALEKALPTLKSCCVYCRGRAEAMWRAGGGGPAPPARCLPAALALLTAALYALYFFTHLVYSLTVWAIEPLCGDDDKECEKVTHYEDIPEKTDK